MVLPSYLCNASELRVGRAVSGEPQIEWNDDSRRRFRTFLRQAAKYVKDSPAPRIIHRVRALWRGEAPCEPRVRRRRTTAGLCEYQFRKYSPALGRWMSRDPIGEAGGNAIYASPSDVNQVDAFGLTSIDISGLLKNSVGGIKKIVGIINKTKVPIMILIAEAGHLASQITGHYTAEVSNVDYDVKCPAGSSSVMLLKYEHIEWITETHGISSILKDLVQKYEYKTKEMKIQVFGCCCEGRSSPWDEPKIKSPMPEYITYDINSFLVVSTESTVLRHKKTTIQNRRCLQNLCHLLDDTIILLLR